MNLSNTRAGMKSCEEENDKTGDFKHCSSADSKRSIHSNLSFWEFTSLKSNAAILWWFDAFNGNNLIVETIVTYFCKFFFLGALCIFRFRIKVKQQRTNCSIKYPLIPCFQSDMKRRITTPTQIAFSSI